MSFYQSPGYRSSGSYNNSYGNSSSRPKWWVPSNDKEKKLFESYKSDIKTALTISTRGISTRKAYEDFAEQIDGEIRYKDLGFKNFGEFLFHCDDVLQVRTDGNNGYYIFLRGRADEDAEHIRRLVEGQSKNTKYKGFKARLGNTMAASSDILLRVLSRPEPINGMSNSITRPKSSYGPPSSSRYNGYKGRGRGYGRPNRGGGSSSSFTAGINGIPKLVSYNPQNVPSRASFVNAACNYDSGKSSGDLQSLEPLPPTPTMGLGYVKFGSSQNGYGSSGRTVSQGMLRAVMSHIDNEDYEDSDDDDMSDWTWSSTADDNKKFQDQLCWSDGEDMVDSNLCAKTAATSLQAKANQISSSLEGTKSNLTKSAPQNSQLVSPVVPLIRPGNNSASNPSSLLLSPPKPVKTETSAHIPSSAALPSKPINPFYPPDAQIKQKEFPSVIVNKPALDVAVNVVSASTSIPAPLAKTESTLVEPWIQMKMPTSTFSAKLLGVDGFGFMFIQINDVAINRGFEDLRHSIQKFYSEEKLAQYRMDPSEMIAGLMVVANVEGEFIRANIYETDVKNGFCILVDLEDHDFHFVDLNNIYHIEKSFRARRPRAIMCTLAGLEPHMMTQEITDAFEVTPLYPPDCRVTLIQGHSEVFKVPSVTMTIRDGIDVKELLVSHGGQFLKVFKGLSDHKDRRQLQDLQMDILQRRNYFPISN